VVQGLTIKGSEFTYFRGSRAPLRLRNATASGNWQINGNKFWDVATTDQVEDAAIRLPYMGPLTGKNAITGNEFKNSAAPGPGMAISWYGPYQTGGNETPSNLTISDNDFDGYLAQSIMMNRTGTVTIERNLFGASSGTRPQPDTKGEETAGGGVGQGNSVMVMNYNNAANRRMQTWFPTQASVADCALKVDVTPPDVYDAPDKAWGNPGLPVRLDFYYTADRTAELFLASVDLTTAEATSVTLPDLPPGPGYVRLQTQGSTANGMRESSQYSRTVPVADPGFCYEPHFTIGLQAWRDIDPSAAPSYEAIVNGQAAATEVPDGARLLPAEQPTWFTYTVENTGWLDIDVDVKDDHGHAVCLLEGLEPGQRAGCAKPRDDP
jgi:hypothetical protein